MKKLTLGIGLLLAISAFFVATQPITPQMAFVSSVSVLFFAVPSYMSVTKLAGAKRGAALLLLMGLYALFIESLAIKTGFPYGDFIYKDVLGNKIFGLTPWTVAFAYPPIILLTYWFARVRHGKNKTAKILFSTAYDAMLIDLVLDPAAVKLGFWYWPGGGSFYNVPLVNFAGWLLTGALCAALVHVFLRKHRLRTSMAISGLLIVWFWTWVNIWLVQIVPAAVGLFLVVLFFSRIRGEKGILTV